MAGSPYSQVARAWAVVFGLVGLAFLLVPRQVGAFLSALSKALPAPAGGRNPGVDFWNSLVIDTAPGNLWYVLALSLMVAVTVLAWVSAGTPDPRPFRALLAAKIASTAGFAVLSLSASPTYFFAFAGDGFVALTLWAAWVETAKRRARRPAYSDGPPGFGRVYAGFGPFYEVWFGKLDVAPGQAFWFRYTLLDGAVAQAATWAIWFDAAQGIVTGKNTCDLREVGFGRAFQGPDGWLDVGSAAGQAGPIEWHLTFLDDSGKRFDHVPPPLARSGIAKSRYRTPFADVRFSGTLRIGDREMAVQDATGMIGHIDGSRSGHSWAWTHCNAFADVPDAVFEGLSARIKVAGRPSPPLTSLVLWLDGQCYRFSSTLGLLMAKSTWGHGIWAFHATAGGVTLEGEASAPDPAQVALVTYTDTDGSTQWCQNSKLASLRLRLRDPARGLDRTLVASGTAAFEVVTRDPPGRPPDL